MLVRVKSKKARGSYTKTITKVLQIILRSEHEPGKILVEKVSMIYRNVIRNVIRGLSEHGNPKPIRMYTPSSFKKVYISIYIYNCQIY